MHSLAFLDLRQSTSESSKNREIEKSNSGETKCQTSPESYEGSSTSKTSS